MHRDKTYTARELAKKSGLRNVQDFNNLLEASKLQLKRHGTSGTLCKVCSFSGYTSTGCEVHDFNNLLEDSKLQLKRHGTSVTLCKVCSFSGYASTGCEVHDFNNLLEDSKLELKRHGTSGTLCKVCSFSGYASTGCEVLKSGYANYNTRWTQKAEHSYLIKLHS